MVEFVFVPWWPHQMETFSALLAICAGNSPVPGEFPAQRPVTRSFDVSFNLSLNKRLRKQSWEAGDLRRCRAHYDVTVMILTETLHRGITFAVSKFALLSVPRTSVTSRLMDLCNSSLIFILKSKYFLTWYETKFIHTFLMHIFVYVSI